VISASLPGIAASDGVAIAKAYLLVEPDLSFTNEKVTDTDAETLDHQVLINAHQRLRLYQDLIVFQHYF
jgi:phosphotransferase system enzyme I (PtsI)